MKNPALIAALGLLGAAAAYFFYRYSQTPTQTYQTTSINPYSDPQTFTTSPYQTYPFQANQPPRVDNSNQPWAANNRAAISQVSSPQIDVNLSNVQMIASYAKSANDIATNLTSLWENSGVSNWFNSGDANSFMNVSNYTNGQDDSMWSDWW